MKIFLSIVFLTIISSHTTAQHKKAYQLFDAKGNKSDYQAIIKNSVESDVIFFGELHNNPISHWLQLEALKDLHEIAGDKLILGAEYFESDNQLILNEYLTGLIAERNFESEAKLWGNYKTDIRPLVEYAKENNLQFIASNIPRRYAAKVNRGGFEALENLSGDALSYIAPLPVDYNPELPAYKQMLEMSQMHNRVNENFPKAQAIKDATMAHFIYKNLDDDNIMLHINGAFHSNNYEGIVWYLNNLDDSLKITTISTVEQNCIDSLKEENHQIADFIIAVPSTMTKTH